MHIIISIDIYRLKFGSAHTFMESIYSLKEVKCGGE